MREGRENGRVEQGRVREDKASCAGKDREGKGQVGEGTGGLEGRGGQEYEAPYKQNIFSEMCSRLASHAGWRPEEVPSNLGSPTADCCCR